MLRPRRAEYGITVTADYGTAFAAAVRRGKALSFATNTAMYYIHRAAFGIADVFGAQHRANTDRGALSLL